MLHLIPLHYHKLPIYLGNDYKGQKGENKNKSKDWKYADDNRAS